MLVRSSYLPPFTLVTHYCFLHHTDAQKYHVERQPEGQYEKVALEAVYGAELAVVLAGEAEELVGAPVDFVLRPSLEKSPNRFAREHILSTAVCIYGG